MGGPENHEAVVELLLNDDNIDVNTKDNSSRTPLLWAIIYGNSRIVWQLCPEGSEELRNGYTRLLYTANKDYKEVLKSVPRDRISLDSTETRQWTLLWLAILYGHEKLVNLLLSKGGSSLNIKNHNNWTEVLLAVEWLCGCCGATTIEI